MPVLCDAVNAVAEVKGRRQGDERIEGHDPRVAQHFVCVW